MISYTYIRYHCMMSYNWNGYCTAACAIIYDINRENVSDQRFACPGRGGSQCLYNEWAYSARSCHKEVHELIKSERACSRGPSSPRLRPGLWRPRPAQAPDACCRGGLNWDHGHVGGRWWYHVMISYAIYNIITWCHNNAKKNGHIGGNRIIWAWA